MTYILVDTNHLFNRCKHAIRGDADTRGGMAIHIIFTSLNKIWKAFKGTHVVFALEGGRRTDSWRYDQFQAYKVHREVKKLQRTKKEIMEDDIFFEYMNELVSFISERTNCTVLQTPKCEADDCIARWIQVHPDKKHVILSSDTDFYQLLSPIVQIYNGITQETINLQGFFDDSGKPVINKKTGREKTALDPKWELFKKCMIGDSGDGVFRAAPPRIRETKIREAWEDREGKGFSWNNLMLSTWVDHNEEELRVIDRYQFNERLVDLSKQPSEIIQQIDNTILQATQREKRTNVGVWFLKFCNTYSLERIGKDPKRYVDILNASYGDK